jgi:hypothetical protein
MTFFNLFLLPYELFAFSYDDDASDWEDGDFDSDYEEDDFDMEEDEEEQDW